MDDTHQTKHIMDEQKVPFLGIEHHHFVQFHNLKYRSNIYIYTKRHQPMIT